MSEYQYFEFQAIDRPLTEGEMRALRAYSTRVTITCDEARRRREKAIAREKYLKSLAKREPAAWRKVAALIATLKPCAYDEAVRLPWDLRDVAAGAGRAAETRRRIERLRDEHTRKPTFVERLRRAGLVARGGQ